MPPSQARQTATLPNTCGDGEARVEAAKLIAASNDAIAAAIHDASATFAPLAEAASAVIHRLDMLCDFLRKKGPWILGSIPTVLVAIQAISPQAAKALAAMLHAAGAQ